jgi:hypothetical protein
MAFKLDAPAVLSRLRREHGAVKPGSSSRAAAESLGSRPPAYRE